MKRIEKIVLSLLALIYLTYAYSNFIDTSPLHFIASLGTHSKVELNGKSTSPNKSFIYHRRHLPLTKKFEIGKHYPAIINDYNSKKLYEEYITLTFTINEYHNSPLRNHHGNKAPPFFC